jgi:hypothetical protein
VEGHDGRRQINPGRDLVRAGTAGLVADGRADGGPQLLASTSAGSVGWPAW